MKDWKQRIVTFLLSAAGLLLVSGQVHAADQAMIAWGEILPGAGGYDLYFSAMENGEWTAPQIMSDSPKPDILPALAANRIGDIWLVWTQLENVSGSLKYRHRINGQWSPVVTFRTGLKTNMAPTVIVDEKGGVWLAWSGVQDHDDDIYFSRWQGVKWAKPVLVHPDNNVPDILPQLSLSSEGKLLITWMSYKNGRYEYLLREWNGRQWRAVSQEHALFTKSIAQENELQRAGVSQVPAFIRDTSQASIIVDGNAGSMRVKELDR